LIHLKIFTTLHFKDLASNILCNKILAGRFQYSIVVTQVNKVIAYQMEIFM